MHIGHDSPPGVTQAHDHRPLEPGEGAGKAGGTEGAGTVSGDTSTGSGDKEPAGHSVSEVAGPTRQPTPPLSASSLSTALEAQSDAAEQPSEPAVGVTPGRGRSAETPAARARALVASDPTLAERPFGQIVSAIARGIAITSPNDETGTAPDEPEPDVNVVPEVDPPATETPDEDLADLLDQEEGATA